VLVADASVLAPAIADGGEDGARYRNRLRGEMLAVPELARIEVLSVLRRQLRHGPLTQQQADAAVADLASLPLKLFPLAGLIHRCWELRDQVAANDACYVALAESLGCTLLTADSRLAGATGPACTIEVL
jgi:predicted nucleic acid-binding protein